MRAVVLVGGYGTRLRPLTLTRPKQLLPVGNRPMLESVLGHLVEHGIEEVVLSLGYRPDAFRVAYPEDVCAGAKLTFAVEDEPLGTAGAIRFAARSAEIDEPFLVCNGDVLTDLDVGELLRRHEAGEAEATIHLVPVDDPSRFGVVVTDPAGRVEAFVEKPPAGWAPSNLINAGTYVFEPSVLGRIPGGGAVSVEREVFPAIVAAGRLHAHHLPAAWVDAGTPEALLDVNLARLGAGPLPDVRGTVADDATVERSLVGAGATVGAGARVEGSVVFDGAHVGPAAVVEGSLIGWGAEVGSGATLRGCVLGEDAVVEPGERLVGSRRPEPPPPA